MELLVCISIYCIFFLNNTLSVVLYGAVEQWLSGALVNVGDMIWYEHRPTTKYKKSY